MPAETKDVVDIDDTTTEPTGDFDYERLTYVKGMPDEAEIERPAPAAEPRPPPKPVAEKPPPPPPKQMLVPREMWPDYPCDEHDGRGWLAEVLKKAGKYSYVKFINATNSDGRKFYSEWVESTRLLPLDGPAPTE